MIELCNGNVVIRHIRTDSRGLKIDEFEDKQRSYRWKAYTFLYTDLEEDSRWAMDRPLAFRLDLVAASC